MKTWLKQMQSQVGLRDSFLVSIGPDIVLFGNPPLEIFS
jgi:hypothetical protein